MDKKKLQDCEIVQNLLPLYYDDVCIMFWNVMPEKNELRPTKQDLIICSTVSLCNQRSVTSSCTIG